MNLSDFILQRRSVRTYTGRSLDDSTVTKITAYIAGLQAPFGAACRIELVRTAVSAHPVRLGTYGAIKGASDFLALVTRDDGPLSQEGAAYMFEQVVLFCTSLGLGTCWLAGFFDRGGFRKQLSLLPGERLRSVSPVGWAADKPHRSISTLFSGGKPTPRKPFSDIFFYRTFGTPLSPEQAGAYHLPLEMVRRAPSANNKQPWRVVFDDDAFHFYKLPSLGYESLDAGIALCHFAETCRETGIPGYFSTMPGTTWLPQKASYIISWIIT